MSDDNNDNNLAGFQVATIAAHPAVNAVVAPQIVRFNLIRIPTKIPQMGAHVEGSLNKWWIAEAISSDHSRDKTIESGFDAGLDHISYEFSDPGIFVICCRVRVVVDDGREAYQTYSYTLHVKSVAEILNAKVDSNLSRLAHPEETLIYLGTKLATLQRMIADNAQPGRITLPAGALDFGKHQRYFDSLQNRLASTKDSANLSWTFDALGSSSSRHPISAAWLRRTGSGQADAKPLNFFITLLTVANSFECRLVDWTDPTNSALTSETVGHGSSEYDAIDQVLTVWSSNNRYPDGDSVEFLVPASLTLRSDLRKTFVTTGKTSTDEVLAILDGIALAVGIAAAIVAVVAIPGSLAASAAIWGTLASSAAGASSAILNVGQLKDEGFLNEKKLATNSLTVVANLFPFGGAWARGAIFVDAAAVLPGALKRALFIGEHVGNGLNGILATEGAWDEINTIANDPSRSAEKRMDDTMGVLAKLVAQHAVIAVAVHATAKDLNALSTAQKPLPGGTTPPTLQDRLNRIIPENPDPVPTTKPPEVLIEPDPPLAGHTDDNQHKTVVQEGHIVTEPKPLAQAKKFDPAPAPAERGMSANDDFGFGKLSQDKGYYVLVRDSNKAATKWIGKPGYKPKPQTLKAKSIPDGQSSNSGLASGNPNDSRLTQMLKAHDPPMTYEQYTAELKTQDMQVLGPPDYLVENINTHDKFYSDYDLHGVYDKSGADMWSDSLLGEFNQKLDPDGLTKPIQHGPHDNWPDNMSATAGPNRGPQPPVTVYMPDGSTQHLATIADMKQFYSDRSIKWPYAPDF